MTTRALMLAFCLSITLGNFLKSQSFQNEVDSLKQLIQTEEIDTLKIDLVNHISYAFRRMNPDSTLWYANLALKLSNESNYIRGKSIGNKNKGIAYYKIGAVSDTIEYYYQLSIENAKLVDDYYTQAACFNNIGLMKLYDLEIHQAIEYFLKGLNLFEREIQEENRLKALILGNLGTSYFELNEFAKGLRYHEQGLKIAKALNEKTIISFFLDEVANAKMRMKVFDEAIPLLEEAIPLQIALNDLESLAETKHIYAEIENERKNFKHALGLA